MFQSDFEFHMQREVCFSFLFTYFSSERFRSLFFVQKLQNLQKSWVLVLVKLVLYNKKVHIYYMHVYFLLIWRP